jgi:hypothetical protein
MVVSLAGLGLLLGSAGAFAQDPSRTTTPPYVVPDLPAPTPEKTLHFIKPAGTLLTPTPAPVTRSEPVPTNPAAPAVLPSAPQPLVIPSWHKDAPKPTSALPSWPIGKEVKAAAPAPRAAARTVQPVGLYQPPMRDAQRDTGRGPADDTQEYQVQLEPPGPQRLFRLESEANVQERWRQEARERPGQERIEFPVETPVGEGRFVARTFPPGRLVVEPDYVCYDRMFFEDLNTERYGWDLGFIQPIVSTAHFYCDLLALPYRFGTDPCRCYECSAGYCLPGDPVPYLLYPPQLSLTGAIFEAGTTVGLLAIFP